jgi:hypothetical protein
LNSFVPSPQNLIQYTNRTYQSAIKAEADVHAGGNFFWSFYRDYLILEDDGKAIMKRVYLKSQGAEINKEILLYEGVHKRPDNGYYLFDLHLENKLSRRSWCCEIVEGDKLVCHGNFEVKGVRTTLETELFKLVAEQ